MTILSYIIASLVVAAAIPCLKIVLDRHRRNVLQKIKAEELREANRTLEVWICRACGFMSLMRNEECTWCGALRPDEFFSRLIPRKDFTAQLQKPAPKRYSEGPGNFV